MAKKERTKEGRKAYNKDKKYSKPFVWFIRILFAVIVGNGFRAFSENLRIEEFIHTPNLILLTFFAYFLAGYFFVISDFLFYHIQIQRHPYRKGRILRFLLDIVIFFLLYLLLDLASNWPTPRKFWAFLLLLGTWHFCVMLWQFHVSYEYDRNWNEGLVHLLKSVIYFFILRLYTISQSGIPAKVSTEALLRDSVGAISIWIWAVVVLIVISNGKRLHMILKKN